MATAFEMLGVSPMGFSDVPAVDGKKADTAFESGRLVMDGSAREYLATIAGQAIELIGGEDRARIRQCEGEDCALLFLALSRSGARRWCSMSVCGNRAKAREFRKRGRGIRAL